MAVVSDVLDFRTSLTDSEIYQSLANELQRSLLQALDGDSASAQELHHLHPAVSAATLARALAQLVERGLLQRRAGKLSLASEQVLQAIELAASAPGGLATLRVLANPLARTIVEELLTGRRPRHELSWLGPGPRVSEILRDLELLGAVRRDGELVLLIEPEVHRAILDVVDEVLAVAHRREYLSARSRLRARTREV